MSTIIPIDPAIRKLMILSLRSFRYQYFKLKELRENRSEEQIQFLSTKILKLQTDIQSMEPQFRGFLCRECYNIRILRPVIDLASTVGGVEKKKSPPEIQCNPGCLCERIMREVDQGVFGFTRIV